MALYTGASSMAYRLTCVVVLLVLIGCDDNEPAGPVDMQTSDQNTAEDTTLPPPTGAGFSLWEDSVQELLVQECGSCHLGKRFAFASLDREGDTFTEAETLADYRAFFPFLSLDAPLQSRILAKVLPSSDPRSIPHGGGALIEDGDATYSALLAWAQAEKSESCADCGLTASRAFIVYVEQPAIHWAANRQPVRLDWQVRKGARIMMQPIEPATRL